MTEEGRKKLYAEAAKRSEERVKKREQERIRKITLTYQEKYYPLYLEKKAKREEENRKKREEKEQRRRRRIVCKGLLKSFRSWLLELVAKDTRWMDEVSLKLREILIEDLAKEISYLEWYESEKKWNFGVPIKLRIIGS